MVWPLVVLLSSRFVYSIPRASTLKLYRLFWLATSVVACTGLKSWRYEWAKIGENSALRGEISVASVEFCGVFPVV